MGAGCFVCHRPFMVENLADVGNIQYVFTDCTSVQYVCISCQRPRRTIEGIARRETEDQRQLAKPDTAAWTSNQWRVHWERVLASKQRRERMERREKQVMANPATAAWTPSQWRTAWVRELVSRWRTEIRKRKEERAPTFAEVVWEAARVARSKDRPSASPGSLAQDSLRIRRSKRLRDQLKGPTTPLNDVAWDSRRVLPQGTPQPHQCCALICGHGIHPQCPNLGLFTHRKQLFCAEHFLSPEEKKANTLEDLAAQAPIRALLRAEGVQGIGDSRLLQKAQLLRFAKDKELTLPLLKGKVMRKSKDNIFQLIYLTSVARAQHQTLKEAATAAGATMADEWGGERTGDGTWERLPKASHGTTGRWGWDWNLYPCSAEFVCPQGCPTRWYGEYMELWGLTQHQVEAEAKRLVACSPLLLLRASFLSVVCVCWLQVLDSWLLVVGCLLVHAIPTLGWVWNSRISVQSAGRKPSSPRSGFCGRNQAKGRVTRC